LESLTLPEILNIPEKLLPIITQFNEKRYFLIEGGRGGAKSQSIGRFLLYLAEKKTIRIVCGREIQNSISESVYTLLSDLITNYNLYFETLATKILHKESKSSINFRGFREQGRFNIQGMEGVDILWIDEAQAITKQTLDILIPTIRKEKAKVYFTMNRFLPNDPVYEAFINRENCLHININYPDNPFCPEALKKEAEECKRRSEKDYRHIWLGEPLTEIENALIDYNSLEALKNVIHFIPRTKRLLSCDPSMGGDECVIYIFENTKIIDEKVLHYDDTMKIVGEIMILMQKHKLEICAVDTIGIGKGIVDRLRELGKDVIAIDSAEKSSNDEMFYNRRVEMWWYLLEEIQKREIEYIQDEELKRQLTSVKRRVINSNGKIQLEPKEDTKKRLGRSPDRADAFVYGIWGLKEVKESDVNTMVIRQHEPVFSGAGGY
jgi:phage terminase large subunit